MMNKIPFIWDVHRHVIPEAHQVPKSISKSGYFAITERLGRQFMEQSFISWSRPISHPTFFLHEQMEHMQTRGVGGCFLPMSQFYCNLAPNHAIQDMVSFQNDFQLQVQAEYPDWALCGFVVVPRLIARAVPEIEKRVKDGLKFLSLPTHYRNVDDQWCSTTDDFCQEIFRVCQNLNVPINIHPYDYESVFSLTDIDASWAGHKSPMPALTAHWYDRFVSQNLQWKFPELRVFLSHANAVGLAMSGRVYQAWLARPDLRGEGGDPYVALRSTNIFYDTITHDPDLLGFLSKKVPASQFMHGSDSPFPLADGCHYLGDGAFLGRTVVRAMQAGYFTEQESNAMFTTNIFRWLNG